MYGGKYPLPFFLGHPVYCRHQQFVSRRFVWLNRFCELDASLGSGVKLANLSAWYVTHWSWMAHFPRLFRLGDVPGTMEQFYYSSTVIKIVVLSLLCTVASTSSTYSLQVRHTTMGIYRKFHRPTEHSHISSFPLITFIFIWLSISIKLLEIIILKNMSRSMRVFMHMYGKFTGYHWMERFCFHFNMPTSNMYTHHNNGWIICYCNFYGL